MQLASHFLDADAIRAETPIRHVELHDTLDSTNNRAIELARQSAIELPALVVARHQTAGRGRGQNKWWSADGALTFSVLLDPSDVGISTANWPQLSLATAVAVCDAVENELGERSTDENPQSAIRNPQSTLAIKWPNDVLLDGRKLAGILLESPVASPTKNRLIIGIGINVNNVLQTPAGEPPPHAVALCDVTRRGHDLQSLLTAFLQAFERRLSQQAANDHRLPSDWQRLAWLAEREVVRIETDTRSVAGRFVGIGDDGALLLEAQGTIERVYSGSVASAQR